MAFVLSQGQNLARGDVSDALKHEQSVETLEGTSEFLPLPLWVKKQKPWDWKLLAKDPESGIEPRPLTPDPCPFHFTRLLVLVWNQLLGSLVNSPLRDFYSVNSTTGAAPPNI